MCWRGAAGSRQMPKARCCQSCMRHPRQMRNSCQYHVSQPICGLPSTRRGIQHADTHAMRRMASSDSWAAGHTCAQGGSRALHMLHQVCTVRWKAVLQLWQRRGTKKPIASGLTLGAAKGRVVTCKLAVSVWMTACSFLHCSCRP